MAIERDDQENVKAVSRRGFLTGLGAGAAGAAGAVVLPTDAEAQSRRPREPEVRTDRFTRLFPNLRPFAEESDQVTRALIQLGAAGGIMDAQDPLEVGPVRLITEPLLSPRNADNAAHTAGTTFFGQFLDHDMTFDTASRLGVATRPERSPNARTPVFDLDTVYGGGPTVSRQLYQTGDRSKFIVEHGGLFEDLPRMPNGTAIIPDPRNDENMMISGIQAAMLLFHNNVVDMLRENSDFRSSVRDERVASGERDNDDFDRDRGDSTFDEARRIVTWHYQWIILNEFLPQILGAGVVNNILRSDRRIFTPRVGQAAMPVEFQLAYRFGHSLIRPSYRANLKGDPNGPPLPASAPPAFFGFIFSETANNELGDPSDLRGGFRSPRRFIGWQTFFNFGATPRPGGAAGTLDGDVRPNKIIDTKISSPLFKLPIGAIASGDPPISLPERNLLRHLTWSVPSGQDIARELRIPALSSDQLSDLRGFGVGFERSTPIWFYILREAELVGGRDRLVGVGARMIGDVFIGLLKADPNSFLNRNPRWRPTLPARAPGTFGMVDLLTFAKVDPTSRGQ